MLLCASCQHFCVLDLTFPGPGNILEKSHKSMKEKIACSGIGTDGHTGFNEPTSSLASRTRIKTLTDQTRKDDAAAFDGVESVPYHVINMGVGAIMESRLCLLLAVGRDKAKAVAGAAEEPITAMVPASFLQLHPRAVFLLDEEAASARKGSDFLYGKGQSVFQELYRLYNHCWAARFDIIGV